LEKKRKENTHKLSTSTKENFREAVEVAAAAKNEVLNLG
jgi:hypothetical protein